MKVAAGFNLGVNVNSCGCLQRESRLTHSTTHGRRRTHEYNVWAGMIQRCTNPNSEHFADYGGRGISVCPEWAGSFQAFFDDMGEAPAGTTLDRLDNSVGYTPHNCAWVSRKEQARNRRSSRLMTYRGLTLTVAEWAERTGMKYGTLHARVSRCGWSDEQALTTP